MSGLVGWAAVKAFAAPLLRGLGAFFTDPRVLAVIGFVALAAVSYGVGRAQGRAACESEHDKAVIAKQAATIEQTAADITAARDGAADLKKDFAALKAGIAAARKDFHDALPPRDADHGCDLPGGPTRRLLNKSSGWPD